jgi:hypothetical protein
MATPKLSEYLKVQIGIVGQAINNTNVTGAYFDMRQYRKALAVMIGGASAVTTTAKLEWIQASALAGTGAKVVKQSNASSGTESSATITVPTAVTKATVALSTVLAGDTITINGVTFTAHANTTTASKREFAINGTDAQDGTALHGLINNATYGVPGITSSDATNGTLTLTSTNAGATTITLAQSSTTFTFAATEQLAYSEIDVGDLDHASGFYYVAPKITNTGNGIFSVTVLLAERHVLPAQKVGAGTAI